MHCHIFYAIILNSSTYKEISMYTIRATEERNEKATEYETKSLLFMMSYFKNSDKLQYFAIDFFNDLSVLDSFASECCDVQSKGVQNIAPKQLGKYLVTLFRNYVSELNFVDFFICIDSISTTLKADIGSKKIFSFGDFSSTIQKIIYQGLFETAHAKDYFEDKSKITKNNLDDFLSKVHFIICDKSKEQYIKEAVDYNISVVDERYFRKIFKEIRDFQSSKKNNNLEGTSIPSLNCVFKYDKYIHVNDIRLFIISRITSQYVTKDYKSCPKAFINLLSSVDETIRDEFLEDCQDDYFRMVTNVNNAAAYWALFEDIFKIISTDTSLDIDGIYSRIDVEKMRNVQYMNINSCRYFISIIKEGIKNAN